VITLSGVDGLRRAIGEELEPSPWVRITQDAVDAFAEVTGDHQWIHIDPERAGQTPFGGTIAHGYLTLSLLPRMWSESVAFEGFGFALNYGLNRLRFPAPVPVGSSVRARTRVDSVDDIPGGVQMTCTVTFEGDSGEKPVCVAETLTRFYV
jgi:acyl dehydratase